MAADISRVKTERYTPKKLTFTALSTTGKTIDFGGVDENTVLIFTSDATDGADDDTITVVAGGGIQGVQDITLGEIKKGEYSIVALSSGEFKQVAGANKGYIVVKGKATTSVAVAEIDQL